MRKFKLIKQDITKKNQTQEEIIECDDFKLNKDKIIITKENFKVAKKEINKSYKIGDIHYSPLKSVLFIKDNIEIKNINVFADPYYKLFEEVMIDSHQCGN